MCWEHFFRNKNWALWFSGFFAAAAAMSLFFIVLNIEVTVFGIRFTSQLQALRFAAAALVSLLLAWYWAKAQERKKRR